MRKKIRLTEEQLVGIIKKVISEQSSTLQATKTIYNDIVNAVKGWGTDVDKVYSSLAKINTVQQFNELRSMFKDKRTGYSSFEEMIDEEYDRFNFNDVVKIKDLIQKKLNGYTTFKVGESYSGDMLFLGEFGVSFPKDTNTEIDAPEFDSKFQEAKKFWLDWLKDPKTKEKFMKIWNFNPHVADRIFSAYINIIKQSKLVLYDVIDDKAIAKHGKNAAAYCVPAYPYTVFMAKSYFSNTTSLFIHELQHLLYYYHPLNPDSQVTRLFAGGFSDQTAFEDENRKNTLLPNILSPKTKSDPFTKKLEYLSSKYGFKINYLKELMDYRKHLIGSQGEYYVCDETEQLSRIMSIRYLLNLKPGQDITLDMFKKLVNNEYKFYGQKWVDVGMFLSCWAQGGYKDPNLFLKQLNYLAKNNQKNDIIRRTA